MNKDLRYFGKELKRHYSFKFLAFFLILIGIILTPLLLVYEQLKFDPKEFANIYLSTVFTSLLIAVVLQVIELYKSSLASYSKILGVVDSMGKLVKTTKEKVEKNETNLSINGELLLHYKNTIASSFTSDNDVNEILLQIYNRPETLYIYESLKSSQIISQAKKDELIKQLTSLEKFITATNKDL